MMRETANTGIFLVLKPKDPKVSNFSDHHFSVGETTRELVGVSGIEDATIDNKSGNYILRVRTEAQAAKLLKLKKLKDGFKIKIERHVKLNKSKAIIRSDLVVNMKDAALQKELATQKVIGVKSIPPTNRLKILTFRTSTPPPFINIGLIKVKTETFYPLPLICRKCQEVGHITEGCTKAARCKVCSGLHKGEECSNPPACINCGGDHVPLDKSCPTYVQEKRIIKIQTDNDVGHSTARVLYKKNRKLNYIPLQVELADDSADDSDLEVLSTEEPKPPTSASKRKLNSSLDSEADAETPGEDALGHPLVNPQILPTNTSSDQDVDLVNDIVSLTMLPPKGPKKRKSKNDSIEVQLARKEIIRRESLEGTTDEE